jgi:SAM-dependent methyltransferase
MVIMMVELTATNQSSVSLIENPTYVTNVMPRKGMFPERHITLPWLVPKPDIFSPEYNDWFRNYANFTVHYSNLPLAKKLAEEIWKAFKDRDIEKAKKIYEELKPLNVLPFEDRTNEQKWSHMMEQMPGDIGGPNKGKIRETLSAKCKGNVLEAMCGFNSYILPSPDCKVTALDYCQEALERYAYPERTRILFDLNKGKSMNFFQNEEFDIITICFGFQYIQDPKTVFREFNRILSENGSLYLVENPRQHYEDMSCRPFSPRNCASFLKKGRFKKITIKELPIAEEWEIERGGHYYLIKAKKN